MAIEVEMLEGQWLYGWVYWQFCEKRFKVLGEGKVTVSDEWSGFQKLDLLDLFDKGAVDG